MAWMSWWPLQGRSRGLASALPQNRSLILSQRIQCYYEPVSSTEHGPYSPTGTLVIHIKVLTLLDDLWTRIQVRLTSFLRKQPFILSCTGCFGTFLLSRHSSSIFSGRSMKIKSQQKYSGVEAVFPSRKSKEAERGRGQSQEQTTCLQRAKECVHG